MNTLKSAALVIVLVGVLYGVYVTLHQAPAPPPPGMTKEEVDRDLVPPDVEIGASGDPVLESATPSLGASEESPRAMDPAFPQEGSAYAPPQTLTESLPPGPLAESPSSPAGGVASTGHSAPLAEGSPRTEVNLTAANFKRDWINATYQVEERKFREALATLTPYYRSPDLDAAQQAELLEWLDALAAKVIYSKEHLLARPHVVQSDHERLVDVAKEYGVSAQLLASINADEINNPNILIATTQLKVVPGPFRAEVDLSRNEITVFLGNLYAGRFPFALGNEPPQPGQYQVQQKRQEKTYHGDRVIAAGDPANPYGQWWIDLGNNACIHGSPAVTQPGPVRGCISLSPQDAMDLAGILTVGSKVVVR